MDDLLKRADFAIRMSRITRDEVRNDLVNARMAAARIRATLRLVRIEQEQSVNLYGESANRSVASLKALRG